MHIAIEGCSHGELDTIYRAVTKLEETDGMKIDLLLCCGDFQSVRNKFDLKCMAVPQKYMQMQNFHEYYSGVKKAPVLTIFIGGNHEASNFLQELPYGGWVAPNIYYLGYAGVVRYGGLRIGGLSGIYKGGDYLKGHYEKAPYDEGSIRSVYHIRNLEVFRLKQLSKSMDIFLSHDWPRSVYYHGDRDSLLRIKPYFKEQVDNNSLGSRPAEDIMKKLQPSYWFAGHLHVKFAALIKHEENESEQPSYTKFLALDKCLPRREFLQVLEIPSSSEKPFQLVHDLEWLTVLRLTNHLLNVKSSVSYMPGPGCESRFNFTPDNLEMEETKNLFGDLLIKDSDFKINAPLHEDEYLNTSQLTMPEAQQNEQTINFCTKLGIDDPVALICHWTASKENPINSSKIFNQSEFNTTLDRTAYDTSFNNTDNDDIVFELSSTTISTDGEVSVDLLDVSTPKRTPLFSPPKASTPLCLSKPKNDLAEIPFDLDDEPNETEPENSAIMDEPSKRSNDDGDILNSKSRRLDAAICDAVPDL